jgi:hypothetical protein
LSRLASNMILQISASCVARITGWSRQCLATQSMSGHISMFTSVFSHYFISQLSLGIFFLFLKIDPLSVLSLSVYGGSLLLTAGLNILSSSLFSNHNFSWPAHGSHYWLTFQDFDVITPPCFASLLLDD